MLDVADPSGIFLTERRGRDSGSAVVVSMEGTRPLLVEAQALATTTAFGAPRITTNGVDRNRFDAAGRADQARRAGAGESGRLCQCDRRLYA